MLVLGGVSNVPGLMLRMWACGKMFNFNWRPTSRMSNWFVDEELIWETVKGAGTFHSAGQSKEG